MLSLSISDCRRLFLLQIPYFSIYHIAAGRFFLCEAKGHCLVFDVFCVLLVFRAAQDANGWIFKLIKWTRMNLISRICCTMRRFQGGIWIRVNSAFIRNDLSFGNKRSIKTFALFVFVATESVIINSSVFSNDCTRSLKNWDYTTSLIHCSQLSQVP